MSDLLNPDELAAEFGVNRATLLRWANQYGWPRTRVGRRSYWTAEQVEQIKQQHTVIAGGLAPKDGRTARSAARRSA